MTPIDPILGELIDSLSAAEPATELALEWQDEMDQVKARLDRSVDYFKDAREEEDFAGLRAAISALEAAVSRAAQGQGDPDELLQLGQAFAQRQLTFSQQRRGETEASIAALGQLVRVGNAALQGQANQESVLRRLGAAERAVAKLKQSFLPSAQHFPPELAEGIQRGFGELELAFADLEAYRASSDDQDLRRALASVAVGEGLVSLFVRSLEQGPDRWSIPLIGPLLRALEADFNEKDLETLRERGLPELQEMWEGARDTWLVPSADLSRLQKSVDSALRSFLSALARAASDQATFWSSAQSLRQSFEDLMGATLPLELLLQSSLGPEAALLIGLIEDEVPLHQAEAAADAMLQGDAPPFIEELARLLLRYLDEGDKRGLLEGLEILLRELESGL